MADYTVVWRPEPESEFRGDYVVTSTDDQQAIMSAAFDAYLIENPDGDREATYDLCAILKGHPKFFY